MSEENLIDPQIDYTMKDRRYWVRVDVEIPVSQMYRSTRDGGGPMGYLDLTPDETDRLVARLQEMSRTIRDQSP